MPVRWSVVGLQGTARQSQAIADAGFFGVDDPSTKLTQALFDVTGGGIPVEPDPGLGLAAEQFRQQILTMGGGLPVDMFRRVAMAVVAQTDEIVTVGQ